MNKRNIVLTGAAVFSLALLGFGCGQIEGPANTVTNTANTNIDTEWPMFESEGLGLSLRYPTDWSARASELVDYGQSVGFFQPKEAPVDDGSYGYKPPWPYFSVQAYPPPAGETTESVQINKELGRDIDPAYDKLTEVKRVQVGAYEYLQRTIGGEREGLQEYWIVHNGRNYVFNIFDPTYKPLCSQGDICLRMLESVRFVTR